MRKNATGNESRWKEKKMSGFFNLQESNQRIQMKTMKTKKRLTGIAGNGHDKTKSIWRRGN